MSNRIPALKGLLLGDGLSRANGVLRLRLTTERRVKRFLSQQQFAFERNQTNQSEPYVHAHNPEILKLHGGDDCEWFYFSAENAKSGSSIDARWKELAAEPRVVARLGTKTALRNIAMGKSAPHSGHDNPHYFDDIALVRAAGIALVSKVGLEELLSQVRTDISYTHSEDGLWGAEAIATLIFALKGGASIGEGIAQAIDRLPSESWAKREVTRALELTSKSVRTLDRVMLLENDFVDRIYCYPYSSPETLGLLFSHLRHSEDPVDTFMAAYLHRRNTDSLPPLLGFLNGLVHGDQWMPPLRDEARILSGICIPALKGKDFLAL